MTRTRLPTRDTKWAKGRPIEKKSRVIVGVTIEVVKSRSITRLTFFGPTKKLTELLLEFLAELW